MLSKHTNFLLIAWTLLLVACSATKDKPANRLYHTATAYFNWYYNATESFNEVIFKLEDAYTFPEQGFMEVVYYGTETEIQSYGSQFEEIVEKNDAIIFKHKVGSYLDEARLLNGKCWFYRQRYDLALQNFNYVTENYPSTRSTAEAYFYIAQTYYMMGNRIMTDDILQKYVIANDTMDIGDRLFGEIGLFRVRLKMEDEDYEGALKLLEDYRPFIKGLMRKSKATFLLGQLHARNGNFPKALEAFQQVIKMSADYDLIFSAKMQIARLYVDFQEGQDDDGEVMKYLTKLLKDEKNKEYRDQIYYEFALLELKKENRPLAIEYLRKSVQVSVSNQRQKALSYYKIGQIYFYDLQNYPNAQAYYDSAATVAPNTMPEYEEINRLANTLEEYINYLNTIHYQDSMLALAKMPKEELDAYIEELAAAEKARKEAEAEALLAQQKSSSAFGTDPLFQQQLDQQRKQGRNKNGKWYFDEPTSITSGAQQFRQRWGTRPNEDDWRRSSKPAAGLTSSKSGSVGGDEEAGVPKKEAKVDSALLEAYGPNYVYYQDIPTTPEAIAEARQKIEEATYKLGQLYYQKLAEPDSATKTFENLLDRNEDSEFALPARYALYKLYSEKKDPLYRIHANYIVNNFPNSVYAYLILGKDPNDLKKDEEDYQFVYAGLFESYVNEDYETVVGFADFILAQEQYRDKPDIDLVRLMYMRGMSYGYLDNTDSLRAILTRIIETYPDHDVTPMAKETLNFLDNGIPESGGEPSAEAPAEDDLGNPNHPSYKGLSQDVRPSEKIFVLLYVNKENGDKEKLKSKLSNLNRAKFKDKNLRVFVFDYQRTHWMPYIANFGSIEEAQSYIAAFNSDAELLRLLGDGDEIFYITHSNFKVAYGQKRIPDYLNFFSYILE